MTSMDALMQRIGTHVQSARTRLGLEVNLEM